MTEKTIISRKVTLIPIGENRKQTQNYIKLIAKQLCSEGNQLMRFHLLNQYELNNINNSEKKLSKTEQLELFKEKTGINSLQNEGYHLLTKNLPEINTRIIACFSQIVYKKICTDFYNILNNKITTASFKNTTVPIPVELSLKKDEKDKFFFNLPMSKEGKEKYGTPIFGMKLGRDRSNNRIILDRILTDEYKLKTSSIQVKDDDIILNLTVEIPIQVINIDPNKIMGIDLGINRPVSIYITGEKHQPEQINIGLKIQHERMKIFRERKSLQQGLKYSNGGHGQKKKMIAMERQKEKEANWSISINHKISREVINIAEQYKVGVIKMEDLTGITKSTTDYFLKSWAYYQLQTDIEYKAKQKGIQILWVNPKNTSNTCPTCGVSEPLNRNDKDKTKFRCINNECKDFEIIKDADIVAAFNITHTEGKKTKGNGKEARKEKLELLKQSS